MFSSQKKNPTRGSLLPVILLVIGLAGCEQQEVVSPGPGMDDQPVDNPLGTLEEITLVEITDRLGVDFTYRNGVEAGERTILETMGNGVGLVDFDLDGFLDIFLPGGGQFEDKQIRGHPAALLRNLGGAGFRDLSSLAGTDHDRVYSHGCQVADIDNDGFPDLLVTGYGALQLYHNQGDGTFREIHEQAGLDNAGWSTSAGFGDLNADGFVDLYVCNYVDWSFAKHPTCISSNNQPDICSPREFKAIADVLYFNNGDGTFRDVSDSAGLVKGKEVAFSKGLGVLLGDIDLDGDLDIYVANDTTPNFLYINDGLGNFQERGLVRSVAFDSRGGANGSMGLDLGDFNGDLLPDLCVSNYEQEPFGVYENQGQGMFLHASDRIGLGTLGGVFVSFGTSFWDLDEDGDEDLLVTNGHVVNHPDSGQVRQLPLLLVNQQGHRFHRQSFSGDQYFSAPHAGRGMAMGDLDEDGRAEILFANNQERCAIIANQTSNKNHFVRLRLVGRNGSRDAIGAVAVLESSAGNQLRMVKGGGSYMSQNELRLYWGVAEGVEVTGIHITWPNGTSQMIAEVPLDETLVVIESRVTGGRGQLKTQ